MGNTERMDTAEAARPGQVVVVTGASGGIGRATARAFGARGAHVGLVARGEQGLSGAARDVEIAGGKPCVIPTDVADPDQCEAAADEVERAFGPIDVWVNVAFTSVFTPLSEISPAEFRRVTEVSYLGYVYSTMAALRRMRSRDAGTVVQVGSALAYRGIPLQTAYCGAKHAIQGFHEALRCELLHEKSNVHVTMVQMPAVNTPQFSWVLSRLPKQAQPVPPIYQPEVAARAVLYAVDHPRRRAQRHSHCATEQAMMVRCTQLNTAILGLSVEDTVGAVVVALAAVRRFPQIRWLLGGAGIVGLLRVEPCASEIAVQQARCHRIGHQRAHRAAAHPVLAAAGVIYGVKHCTRGDLGLIDGRNRLGLFGQPR